MLISGIETRGYSLVLQRRITDFGAETPFNKVNERLKEHYGITVPENSARTITLRHAHQTKIYQDGQLGKIESLGKACIISETDGSMVPIVKTRDFMESEKIDRRKGKQLIYREAKLTLAHEKGSTTPIFSATFEDAKKAGEHVLHCVKSVGVNEETKVHCVGDGAVWIANQIEEQFGANGTYLIDFCHLCDYLSAAAPSCSPNNEKIWLDKQKELLKESLWPQVLLVLQPYLESQEVPEENAPVRACYRYIKNRPHQLDYKDAIDNELPIGSGEIESAHRYVIQKRLKIAGAWRLEANAEDMLALRVSRANNEWESYWMREAA